MALEIKSGTITPKQGAVTPIPACTATFTVHSNFLPQPGAPTKVDLKLDAKKAVDPPTLTPEQSFPVQMVLTPLLTNWLNANLQEFNHVFASVDFDEELVKDGITWLRPSFQGYAVAEPSSDSATLDNCVFAVLCLIDDTKPDGHLAQQVSPYAIPQGAKAAFLISEDKFLHHIILPALPLLFSGIDGKPATDNFVVDSNGTRISNLNALTMAKYELEPGKEVHPTVGKSNFTVEVAATEMKLSLTDMQFDCPLFGFIPGALTAHITYEAHYSLAFDKAKQIIDLQVLKQTAHGNVISSPGFRIAEVVLGVATIVLSVVGFAGVAVGKVVGGAAVVTAESATLGAVETGALTAVEVETGVSTAMFGLIRGATQTFQNVGAVAAGVVKVGLLGACVTGLTPAVSMIQRAVGDGDYSHVPKLTNLIDTALSKVVTWPKTLGSFEIASLQLNQALQFGLTPKGTAA